MRHRDGKFFAWLDWVDDVERYVGWSSLHSDLHVIDPRLPLETHRQELGSSDITFFALTNAPFVQKVGCGLGRVVLALHWLPVVVHAEYLLGSGIFYHFAGFFL